MRACVCVCVWERERERESQLQRCVCVRERVTAACVCVCVRARVCARGRQGNTTAASYPATHTSFITVSVTRLCSPLGLELMVKLRTLLIFTLVLKAKARDYGKGNYISNSACGVRPITMHWVSWPIRADCAYWKEGLCRKLSVWERLGIEDQQ